MLLPGGVVREGERRRGFAFRAVDGALEAALAEASLASSVPKAVTAVLAAALAELGGEGVTEEAVRALAIGDRQFLMRQLSAHLGHDQVWLTAACRRCGESFDFDVHQSALPVKEASESFPYAATAVGRYRIPTGADQEAIATIDDDDDAVQALLARCTLEGSDGSDPGAQEAMEAASPEVALAAAAVCPACGAKNEVAIDPYLGLRMDGQSLFMEVHRIASAYHWSEAQILALPRERRRLYLRLIDRAQGVAE
jgi:transcription elongation factor Elf1